MGHLEIPNGSGRSLLLILVFFVTLHRINSMCYFACLGVSCMNGGKCTTYENCSSVCDCPNGFTGKHCEILDVNNSSCSNTCSPITCSGQGDCYQDPATCNISCKCFPDFHGDRCKEKINGNQCGSLKCIHGSCDTLSAMATCKCDEGWTGDTCNIGCTRECFNGRCARFGGEESCICKKNYTIESNCTEIEIREQSPQISSGIPVEYLVFIIIFPIILLVVFIVMGYMMWRKRMIFVMKIVYYLQKYEDTDGKLYDAFISFRSSKSDEHWVLNTLFPMLENEMGFRICVHYRDFMAGETISNNIIDAIEKSRRTILVVSPDYANGEWTRMEYQVAQQEMLSLRHKIIPIMFRDIKDLPNVDKNLKLILNSITYIKWPESVKKKETDKFWQQLRLTMPKKHEVKSTVKGGDVINEWSSDTRL